MSLSIALNNALTSLNVNQKALSVLSQNIANANTAGYSRQIINQEAVYLGNNGAGVGVADISRKVDEYLNRAVQLQNSVSGRAGVRDEYYSRTQLLLGGPNGSNSLNTFSNNVFGALNSLSVTPESASLKANAVRDADSFAKQVSRLSSELQVLRFEADKDIKIAVDNINANLRELYTLNQAISREVTAGQNPIGFKDRRDVLVRDLSEFLDIQTFTRENGAINIFTANGINLVDENQHFLTYTPASSADTFVDDVNLSSVRVFSVDFNGNVFGDPIELVSGGPSSQVTSSLTSGKLKGLLDMRDRDLPQMLGQLDNYAATFRDEFNAIHNAGVPYPGLNSYTGTRSVFAEDFRLWSGNMRIAVLNSDGSPAGSRYADESSGFRPLTLDLGSLNTGNGNGFVSVQGLVDEINRYFAPPQNRVTLGNVNNIRIASGSAAIPGSPAEFTFDLDIENISETPANVFVTGYQVLDDTSADITNVAQDVPTIALAATGTYQTADNSTTVTANLTAPPNVQPGEYIFLSTPGGPVDGIPAAELGGYVLVTGVSGNSITFETTTAAAVGGGTSFNVAGQTARPPYATIDAGEQRRTTANGAVRLDLSGNAASSFYTIVADVGVVQPDGTVSTSQVTYRIDAQSAGTLNARYSAQSANGDATVVLPASSQRYATAMLVDENGMELPKVNGVYTNAQKGFLKIVADDASQFIAIDSLNSTELGQPNGQPPLPATNRGFSHYFGLNNFFVEDDIADTVNGAALSMKVRADMITQPNRISLGKLLQTTDINNATQYTYERQVGDNSSIVELAGLADKILSFSEVGGLGQSNQTLGGYLSQIVSTSAQSSNAAREDMESSDLLLEGYSARADSISGVNLDEELGNTIIYQNSYTASARALTVTQELFDELLSSFRQ